MVENCVFCSMVEGKIPFHKVWESKTHLAFLSIFPNIKGFSVVIPKKHLPSNVTELSNDDYTALLLAAKAAAQQISKGLGVERTALIAEGMGVNHAHIKLFPLIGTIPGEVWKAQHSSINKVFDEYEGYVSSHDALRVDDKELAAIAQQIREA